MNSHGRRVRGQLADCNYDRRFRALVLLAIFGSLRWGEVIAPRRCDLDLEACTVRVRAAIVERSIGELLLGPPKARPDGVSSTFRMRSSQRSANI